MRRAKQIVLHPLILAAYPVLFLYVKNSDSFAPWVLFLPVAIVLLAATSAWALVALALRDWEKSGLLVSLTSVGLLLCGPTELGLTLRRRVLGSAGAVGVQLAYVAAVVVLGLVAWAILRHRGSLSGVTRWANAFALSLLAMSVVTFGWQFGANRSLAAWFDATYVSQQLPATRPGGELPNVFYIVLDGYARNDVLQELYDHDGSAFTDYLQSRGFYVAARSRANYPQTALSLAAALNCDDLSELMQEARRRKASRAILRWAISNSRFFRLLKDQGYQTVAFHSGYYPTELAAPDVRAGYRGQSDVFHAYALSNTPLGAWRAPHRVMVEEHRRRILSAFDGIAPAAQKAREPVCVFAHIIAPHPPFVFGEHGEPIEQQTGFTIADADHLTASVPVEEYRARYVRQLTFISDRTRRLVEEILAASPRPAVIILHSDHGPGSLTRWEKPELTNMAERLGILNAVYLPGQDYEGFYPAITPANTVRLVLNKVFGTDEELQPDESYFCTWLRPYDPIRVTTELD